MATSKIKPVPVYRLDPARAFPELESRSQGTDDVPRRTAAMCVVLAYLFKGQRFTGACADITLEQALGEIEECLLEDAVTIERASLWAESVLIEPEQTLAPEVALAAVPRSIIMRETEGDWTLNLHPYQIEVAAWAAHRLGSILALGCGVGKTATAVAAAIAAKNTNRCSDIRCTIVCPVNAVGTWLTVRDNLREHFKEVTILSTDSVHKWEFMSTEGGALIIDEAHKFKNMDSRRSGSAVRMRLNFEWAVTLTATLLHTGAEAVMTLLDVACPGLSRYLDKWAFGEAFDCIITKKVGPRPKRSLGRPPSSVFPQFVNYLKRGVRSLSYASPEVAAVVQIPGQTKTLIDSWAKPVWVREFFAKDEERIKAAAARGDKVKARYLWPPDMSMTQLFAASALALKYENLLHLEKLIEQDPTNEELMQRMEKQENGLPSFAAVVMAVRMMGRFDMIIERIAGEDGDDFRFLYAPDSSVFDPAPGPKIRYVQQWLTENPGEPLVVGAFSSAAIDITSKVLTQMGVAHHIIRGGVSGPKRRQMNDEFDAGKVQVMLVQQVAGSESVDFTRAAVSMLLDHDLSPIIYEQFLRRTNRQGQDSECEHVDMSFCDFQTRMIKRLIEGDAFDQKARKALENEVRYQTVIRNTEMVE